MKMRRPESRERRAFLKHVRLLRLSAFNVGSMPLWDGFRASNFGF